MASSLFSVHVFGLPLDATEQELRDLFRKTGVVKGVYIAGRRNGIDPSFCKKKYGFVRYAYMEECYKAIDQFHGWPLRNAYKLEVSMAREQPGDYNIPSEKRRLERGMDPRAMQAFEESLKRLGMQGLKEAILTDLKQVDHRPVQRWTFPPEDISLNLPQLDSLIQDIYTENEEKKVNNGEVDSYNEIEKNGNNTDVDINGDPGSDNQVPEATSHKPTSLGRGGGMLVDRQSKPSLESRTPPLLPMGRGRAMLERFNQL